MIYKWKEDCIICCWQLCHLYSEQKLFEKTNTFQDVIDSKYPQHITNFTLLNSINKITYYLLIMHGLRICPTMLDRTAMSTARAWHHRVLQLHNNYFIFGKFSPVEVNWLFKYRIWLLVCDMFQTSSEF